MGPGGVTISNSIALTHPALIVFQVLEILHHAQTPDTAVQAQVQAQLVELAVGETVIRADITFPVLLEHLLKVEGGMQQNDRTLADG